MRTTVIVLLIFGVVMLTEAFDARSRGRPSSNNFPTFPGHGPFNPRPKWPEAYGRGRRSAAYVDESVNEDALQGRQARGSESDSWLALD